jgi:putative NADH-flavin reductase
MLSNYKLGTNGFIFGAQGGLRISALDLAKIMITIQNLGNYKGVNILKETTVLTMIQ